MNIIKPTKKLCTLAEAMAWGPGRMTRKYDGIFEAREIGGLTVAGQLMRPKSGGFFTASDRARLSQFGEFWVALDVVSPRPLFERMKDFRYLENILDGAREVVAEVVFDIPAAMADGAEGVCWQDWECGYGEILAYKARWEGVCEIAEPPGGSQSAAIRDPVTKAGLGRIKLGGGKIDQVRAGSLIKVNAMGLTDAGKLREPVLDSDSPTSWLVKV